MGVRDATLADLAALIDVQQLGAVRAVGHIFPQDEYPFPREDLRARWAAEIADPGIEAYVVDDDAGAIVGFAALRGDELLHFGTAVETWGTGLAAEVHGDLMRRLAARHVTRARLRVFEENHRARRFYQKLGWLPTGRVSRTSFPPRPLLLEYALDL
ncbi:GNAT family protein [Luedemannella flava]|uniref:GNAT family N-acetyltransferase n=1 Tax=Luedemannella flava TaxID=349316 RepID=UPI0031D3FA6B